MNFLKIKTTWSNAELALFKICVLAAGIILGVYFNQHLKEYLFPLCFICLITGLVLLYLWIKKMKQ